MSPERLLGEPYDFKADIWSFGVTILTCALGRFPFAASAKKGFWGLLSALTNNNGLEPDFPPNFSSQAKDFIMLCLAREPKDRPTAAELLEHPFVSECTQDTRPLANPPPEWQEHTIAELDHIVAALRRYYLADWSANTDNKGAIVDKDRIDHLADQLALPRNLVRSKFADLIASLQDDLKKEDDPPPPRSSHSSSEDTTKNDGNNRKQRSSSTSRSTQKWPSSATTAAATTARPAARQQQQQMGTTTQQQRRRQRRPLART